MSLFNHSLTKSPEEIHSDSVLGGDTKLAGSYKHKSPPLTPSNMLTTTPTLTDESITPARENVLRVTARNSRIKDERFLTSRGSCDLCLPRVFF